MSAPTTNKVILARNNLARMHVNCPNPEPEKLAAAHRDLKAAKVEVAIDHALGTDPTISVEQRESLAALLLGSAQ